MGEVAWAVTIEGNISNFLTSSQVGCFAAPEWVLTFNLPKNYFDLKHQAIQHGVLRQLRVHVHVHLLRQGRCGLLRHGGLLQEVLRRGEGAWGEVDQVSKQERWKGRLPGHC